MKKKLTIYILVLILSKFLFAQSPDIVAMEYYFDQDPGFGNGTETSITPGSLIAENFNVDLAGLSTGNHRFYVRTKDENGKWSLTYKQDIYITEEVIIDPEILPDIIAAEYYFDQDPGFGNGIPITITPETVIDENFNVDLSGLTTGNHRFYVRTKDENGKWSLTYKQDIYITEEVIIDPVPLPDIIVAEYFFDQDPGFGNGTAVSISPDNVIDENFSVSLVGLSTGSHRFYVRVLDETGKWSFSFIQSIYIMFAADFTADITSGEAPLSVQFTDQSLGIPTSWEWDFDNDGTVDSYEQNPEWTYNEPGTYSISLTVSNGSNQDTEIKTDYITVQESFNVHNITQDIWYITIQEAINASNNEDTILVEPGNYVENINYNGKNITVGSLFLTTQDTTYISQTIIDGNQSGSVVTFESGEDSITVFSGFTIKNGSSNKGGGIYCFSSNPNISNIIITNNFASDDGGGIYCLNSNPNMENVTVKNNTAPDDGGGIHCTNSSPNMENIIIKNNSCNSSGGGIYCYNNSSPNMVNVAITNNSANSTNGGGGGIWCSTGSSPSLVNVTIANNSTNNSGGGIQCYNSNPSLVNCIMWGNTPEEISLNSANVNVTYSDIQDGVGQSWFGIGCIDSDPLFADPNNGNYHLQEDSPCIDAGDPNSTLDPDGTRADMGAYYFHQNLTADFSAEPTLGVAPLLVQFTDLSSGVVTSWQWDFQNDGTIDSEEQNPEWTYPEIGTYSVSLTVSDGTNQDTETKVDYITVLEPVQAEFSAEPTLGVAPLQVQFTDLSSGVVSSWQWDFQNDGTIDSEEQNPGYTYPETGTYSVSLTVSDGINEDTELKEDYIFVVNACEISGMITDEVFLTPIEGANISVTDGLNTYNAISLADGTYLIEGIEPGTYDIGVSAINYISEAMYDVLLELGQTEIINFELHPEPGILSGIVTDFNTSSPIEGALISLEGMDYETITSADGTYEITDIEVGTYDVSVSAINYFGQTEYDIIISSNNTTTLDFSLIPMPGIISGYVTEAGTGDPIEGANITTENADYSAITNSEGFYIIEDVELGFYNIYATAVGYYDASVADVEVLSNQTTSVDFALGHPHFNFEGGNAADPVWTLYLSTAILDELDLQVDDEIGIFDGELLVGAYILLEVLIPEEMFSHELIAFSTLTFGPGYTVGNPVTFKCWDESLGEEVSGFTVEYSDPYGDAWIENTFPPDDGQYSIVDLTFLSGGTISGTITLNGGPGIVTDVLINIGEFSTNPDESGYYEFTELEPGYYDVSATLEFYHFASETVEVIAGEVTIVNFTLNPMLGNIEGIITDYISGEAIVDVNVTIGDEYSTTTNEIGYYLFEGLLIGDYSLNVEIQGYYPEEETNVEVLSDQSTTVNFSLHPIHFSLQPGNPIDPVWQIFLTEATLDELDLQVYDEIAVFDGDILCGQFTVNEVLIPENQYENVFIVWSTLISGEPGYTPGNAYSFKCWDASEGIEVLNYDITFHDPYGDAYTGNVFPEDDGEYSIITADFVTTITQTYDLSIGYQFISSRVTPENQNMQNICTDILDNLGFVRNTAGNMLRKIGPMWINGIGNWVITEGYLFKMNDTDYMEIEGVEIDPQTPIALSLGYQFISFLPDNPVNALTAFNAVLSNLGFVRNTAGNMLRKIGPMWINGIGNLNPGEGYLVKMNAPDNLIYPVSDEKYSGIANIKPEYFNFGGGNAAEAVFTIYVEGLNIGDEIAAFDGEKILGNMKINSLNAFDNDLPVFSITNFGQGYIHGNPINLKVWDSETQKIISPEYTLIDLYKEAYMENNYPAEDGLYSVIKITKSDIDNNKESISIYPNPSEGMFNISIAGVSGKVQIKIFDVHGNNYRFFEIEATDNITIEKLNLKELPAGVYFIRFSGKDFDQVKKIVIQ